MVLYVTSFNKSIYDASGKDLVSTLKRRDPSARVRAYVEGLVVDGLETVDVMEDPWLRRWIAENGHNIPERYGGTNSEGDMPFWNAKASLWFRKAASIVHAYRQADPDEVVVWLDADVLVVKDLPPGLFDRLLGGADVVYHCGTERKKKSGVETGVFALRKNARVDELIDKYVEIYDRSASDWGRMHRWDDGFVMKVALRETSPSDGEFMKGEHALVGGARCRDLATRADNDPLASSPCSEYFVHQKGLHRSLGLDGMGQQESAHKRRRAKLYKKFRMKQIRRDA